MTTEEKKEEKTEENNEEEFKIELLPEDYAQYDLSFKMIVIGDAGVGKSCLTTKAVKDTYEDFYQTTIGFEFLTFNLKINGTVIKLQIWDTCGQEVYKSLISNFYRNSTLAILTYAINDRDSFSHVETWLKEFKSQANKDVKIFLVGNKADLENERKVSKEEGMKYKDELKLDLFMETSAKTGQNARNCLLEAAKMLYKDYLKFKEGIKKGEGNNNDSSNNTRKLGQGIQDSVKKINCCGGQ